MSRWPSTRHHADAPAAGEPFSDALIAGMLVGARTDVALAFNALNTERRNLPMVEISKEYFFEGPEGKVMRPAWSIG